VVRNIESQLVILPVAPLAFDCFMPDQVCSPQVIELDLVEKNCIQQEVQPFQNPTGWVRGEPCSKKETVQHDLLSGL